MRITKLHTRYNDILVISSMQILNVLEKNNYGHKKKRNEKEKEINRRISLG